MSSPANRVFPRRNFDNDTCCETYCPCCPSCNCKCDCSCECNCTKKKMIVPTFILSAIAFIVIIVEMITKVTDTDQFINFKKEEKADLPNYEEYKNNELSRFLMYKPQRAKIGRLRHNAEHFVL